MKKYTTKILNDGSVLTVKIFPEYDYPYTQLTKQNENKNIKTLL